MLEDRSPQNESGSEPPQGYETREPSSMGMKAAIVIVVLIAALAVGYGWLQHNAVQQLASERGDLSASLNQAKSQVDDLTAKVNALSAAQQQEEAARVQAEAVKTAAVQNEQAPPPASATSHHRRNHVANRSANVDDPRWQKVQEQLGDQQKQLTDSQKQIAETQANLEQAKADLNGDLQSTKTELGGNIARTHDELVALEKKGERNYYEFSFEKSPSYHHTGPLSIALRKADSKHGYCDLKLLVDDREISQKHVNLYEAVTLHPEGDTQPIELVINRIDKDSIKGYVSEPKYHAPRQAAAPVAAPATTAAVTVPAPAPASPDATLEHRQSSSQ